MGECEVCFRWLPPRSFPREVINSMEWHLAHPGGPRGRTVWSCKECRAQEVVERERVEAYLNFRIPSDPVVVPSQPAFRWAGLAPSASILVLVLSLLLALALALVLVLLALLLASQKPAQCLQVCTPPG